MNAFGLFIADTFSEEYMGELVERRNVPAVPFGGRYRLVDFMLSSVVNASINEVGIAVGEKHNALVDHLGNGKDWDLNRRNGGLKVLTPYINTVKMSHQTAFDVLDGAADYIRHTRGRYCVLAPANIIANIDFKQMIRQHIDTGADMTVLVVNTVDKSHVSEASIGENGRIKASYYHSEQVNHLFNELTPIYVIDKSFIERFIAQGRALGTYGFDARFIEMMIHMYKVFAYKHEGYYQQINTINDYYAVHMALLQQEVSKELFQSERRIYTKIKDSVPTLYGYTSRINNSLVADGCEIHGQVENSIIFRDVKIGKNAKVSNAIIMSGTVIEEGTTLNHVIADRNTRIMAGQQMGGSRQLPYVIRKGMVV